MACLLARKGPLALKSIGYSALAGLFFFYRTCGGLSPTVVIWRPFRLLFLGLPRGLHLPVYIFHPYGAWRYVLGFRMGFHPRLQIFRLSGAFFGGPVFKAISLKLAGNKQIFCNISRMHLVNGTHCLIDTQICDPYRVGILVGCLSENI